MVGYWQPAHKRKKKESWRWIVLSLILLLMVFFIYRNIELARHRRDYANRAEELYNEVEILKNEKDHLEWQMEITDQSIFLEQIAHGRLNLKKPGEEVIVFEIGLNEEEETDQNVDFWDQLKDKIVDFFKRQ